MTLEPYTFFLIWLLTLIISIGIIPFEIRVAFRAIKEVLHQQRGVSRARPVILLILLNLGLAVFFYWIESSIQASVVPSVLFFYLTVVVITLIYVTLAFVFLYLFVWLYLYQKPVLVLFGTIMLVMGAIIIFLDVYLVEVGNGFSFINPATWAVLGIGVHYLYIGLIGAIVGWFFFFMIMRRVLTVYELKLSYRKIYAIVFSFLTLVLIIFSIIGKHGADLFILFVILWAFLNIYLIKFATTPKRFGAVLLALILMDALMDGVAHHLVGEFLWGGPPYVLIWDWAMYPYGSLLTTAYLIVLWGMLIALRTIVLVYFFVQSWFNNHSDSRIEKINFKIRTVLLMLIGAFAVQIMYQADFFNFVFRGVIFKPAIDFPPSGIWSLDVAMVFMVAITVMGIMIFLFAIKYRYRSIPMMIGLFVLLLATRFGLPYLIEFFPPISYFTGSVMIWIFILVWLGVALFYLPEWYKKRKKKPTIKRDYFTWFILFRILISFVVFIHPFWGVVILILMDYFDVVILKKQMGVSFQTPLREDPKLKEFVPYYDRYDKIGDSFNLLALALVALIFWNDYIILAFFAYRMVGQVIYHFHTEKKWILAIFPNIVGNLFIIQAFFMTFFPSVMAIIYNYYIFFLIFVIVGSIAMEFLLKRQVLFTTLKQQFRANLLKWVALMGITAWIMFFTVSEHYRVNSATISLDFFSYGIIYGSIFLGVFIIYLFIFISVTNSGNLWINIRDKLRVKVGKKHRSNPRKSWIIILTNYSARIVISVIFLLFVSYSFFSMITYLIIVEVMDTTWDSAFTVNLPMKQRNYSFLLDDTTDWVGRTIFFLPFITSIWWMPVFIGYHFTLIGIRIFTPKGRWLKIVAPSVLYITPFYLYFPILFGGSVFVAYILYLSFYWGYFVGKENISE